MRLLCLAGCLLPLFSISQECKVVRETDPYTKETRLSSGFIQLQGSSVTIEADNKEIDFFFIVDGKCFNDASTLVVYFEGTKVKATYRNAGSMNCDGYFHYKVKNGQVTPTAVKKLATQKVTQFIFTPSEGKPVIVTLQPEQQNIFMNASLCMSEEAKKLIQ